MKFKSADVCSTSGLQDSEHVKENPKDNLLGAIFSEVAPLGQKMFALQ